MTFKLKATEEDAQKLDSFNAIVTRLKITDAYNKVDLIIADKDNDSKSGTLDISNHSADRNDFNLKGKIDGKTTSTFAISMLNDGSQDSEGNYIAYFGEDSGLLLVPKTISGEDFTGVLEIKTYDKDEDGKLINETVHNLPLKFKADFEAGKIYNFTILIKSPEEILATAEMETWGESTEGEIDYGDDSYQD